MTIGWPGFPNESRGSNDVYLVDTVGGKSVNLTHTRGAWRVCRTIFDRSQDYLSCLE